MSDGNDFSTSKVLPSEQVNGLQIALVVIGGTIAVPVFLLSANISAGRGLAGAIPAFFLGALVLAILGIATGLVGAQTRYSTYMIARRTFGIFGARIIAFVIALASFGWFAVLAGLFGQALQEIAGNVFDVSVSREACIVSGSVLFAGVSFFGFKAIDKFAMIVVPAMLALLGYMAYWAVSESSFSDLLAREGSGMPLGTAVSAVIGAYIVGAVTNPDFTRYAKSSRDAVIATTLGLAICFPLVLSLVALPSVLSGESDLIKIMTLIGIGWPALAMLVLSTWSSNSLILYSSSLAATTVFERLRYRTLILIFAIGGTGLAIIDVMQVFVPFLIILGTAIPPIGAIYVMAHFLGDKSLESERFNLSALFCWLVGFGFGIVSAMQIASVFNAPSIDAIFAGMVAYALVLTYHRLSN